MFERKIYKELLVHLAKKQITVITGMRRVGKSTSLKYLLNESKNSNTLLLDFERVENRYLFNQSSYADIERGLIALGINLKKPSIIALDEIQFVPNSPSIIKSLYDNYDIKFVVTGSSSYYIKNHFSESLAGQKQIFEMRTLDFEEYLIFKELFDPSILNEKMLPFLFTYYERWKAHYEDYIKYGGFPEVVLAESEIDKTNYIKDIINAYIELDIKLLSDFQISDTLYKLILLISNRIGSKMDYSKIASITGINRNKIKDYLEILTYTYFIQIIPPFAKGIDKELTKQPKIYFSDTGILHSCNPTNSSALFENAIANQLSRFGNLNYFEKSNGSEIDFILNKETAYEVKETCSNSDLKSLKRKSTLLNIKDYKLIGRNPASSGFKDFIWGGNVF